MTLVIDVAYNNMTTKNINGKDVTLPIDWSTISPLPDAVVTKVSELNFTDESFIPNWHSLGSLNIPRGGYHFYRNGQLFYNSGKQAKVFAQAILENGIKNNDYFVCDNEEKNSKGNPIVSMKETLDWFYNVMIILGLPDYERFWLYSTADILNGLNLSSLSISQLDVLKQIKIWTAGYPDVPPAGGDLTNLPKIYTPNQNIYGEVIGWQYEENANVSNIPGGVDLNQITPNFLQTWKAGSVVPTPQPVPQPVPQPQPSQPTITATIDIYSNGTYKQR